MEKISKNLRKRIYLISNYNLLKKQFKKLQIFGKIKKVNNINENSNENKLKIINVDLKFNKPFNVNKNQASKFVINSLNLAHKYALNKNVKGIINCSINKILLNKENWSD